MRAIHALGFFAAAGAAIAGAAIWYHRRQGGLGGAPSVDVPYVTNIEKDTLANKNYRKVLTTSPHSQLVLMSILPKHDIGMEVHPHIDQFLRIERGTGKAILNDRVYSVRDGFSVTVPAGTHHNIVNTSPTQDMKIYTIYSPAKHAPDTVERLKPAND